MARALRAAVKFGAMHRILLCFAALGCAGIGTAAAADDPIFTDRFALTLGTYWMTSDTTLRVDSLDFDLGTEINLEDAFNFDEETVFRVEGSWRFAPRHKVLAMYFDSNRSNTARQSRQIDFGEVTFPINTEVHAAFDFTIIELAYEYAF